MRQIYCFIACAFGRSDVDEIYTKSILKVLEKLKIQPLRVDRINHNKNIDTKIIELINQCNFCIADLTYARPSVYYEAGYVHGLNKEVVFTVRADHLNPSNQDNKIHFDLITQNIISWTSSEELFEDKLRKRIEHITRPIITKLKEDKLKKDAENEFSLLSQLEKRKQILSYSKEIMKERKFLILPLHETPYSDFSAKQTSFPGKMFYITCKDTTTVSDLINFYYYHLPMFFRKNDYYGIHERISEITVVFVSLKSCPESRLQKALPEFHKESRGKMYSYTGVDSFTNGDKKLRISRKTTIAICDKIKSLIDIESFFMELLLNPN